MDDVSGGSQASRAQRLLEGIVPGELLSRYISLLEQGQVSLADATRLLGNAENIETLLGEGLAYLRENGEDGRSTLVPASPDLALQRALAHQVSALAAEHQTLLDGQERLRAAQSTVDPAASGSMDQLAQVLTDHDRIAELTSTLTASARRDWLILGARMVGDRPAGASDGPSTRARCRAIYETRCIESAVERESVDDLVRAGGTVRLLPRIGMSMRLADNAIALLPLTERASSGTVLIQSSVIVGALREYFELLWERAIPYGVPDEEEGLLSPIRMKILRLLVQGLTDEAVAEQLGVSITTVGRHVTAIRDALGVQHRFALGFAAVQQGLVD